MLVRIHTVSVSPDNTIEYSASSLYGDEISFTDELIGKEIFVDLPNTEQDGDFGKEENVTSGMPFKICDSCVGRMNKIIWDEFPYQDMSDEQG